MTTSEKRNTTNIVNAFRLINNDIRTVFNTMSKKLNATQSFKDWKKYEKSITPTIEGYRDWDDFIKGDDNWYYLNCYGEYNKKIIGFTFVISIDYDEKTDTKYSDFINKLDKNINKNSPLLCISGVYSLIDDDIKKAKFFKNEWTYIDDVLQFTGDWKNYNVNEISYDKWIDVEIDYKNTTNRVEGWYREATINIVNILDISSEEKIEKIIDDLIHQGKQT